MPFANFTFPQVQQDLGLTRREQDLYSHVSPVTPRPEIVAMLDEGTRLALAINTEKARSEFIIAPVLLELRRLVGGAVGLFSGIALDVDPLRGLNGVCDFILSREPLQFSLTAPLVTIIEAKNDNLRNGLGQCIASAYAAALFNERAGQPARPVFGAVTTGTAWQFLRLEGNNLTLDLLEYYIDNLGKILGILKNIVETP
jgi:hypothetical protein